MTLLPTLLLVLSLALTACVPGAGLSQKNSLGPEARVSIPSWAARSSPVTFQGLATLSLGSRTSAYSVVLRLGPKGGVRLVGLNEWGLRLFDVSIGNCPQGTRRVHPLLARSLPGAERVLVLGLRRIFAFWPVDCGGVAGSANKTFTPSDSAESEGNRVARQAEERCCTYTFDQAGRPVEKSGGSGRKAWSVRLGYAQDAGPDTVPSRMVFAKENASLTLILQEADNE